MKLQKPDFGKAALRRLETAAHQLLVLIICFALVFHSVPLPANAQGLFGIGGDNQQEDGGDGGFGGLLQKPGSGAERRQTTPELPSQAKQESQVGHDGDPPRVPDMSPLFAYIDELKEKRDQIPNALFDIVSLAATMDASPQSVVDWVSTQIDTVAYLGSLKSPEDVLRDRTANHLDRARLIISLLEAKGTQARLVRYENLSENVRNDTTRAASSVVRALSLDHRELPTQGAIEPNAPDSSAFQELASAVHEQLVFQRVQEKILQEIQTPLTEAFLDVLPEEQIQRTLEDDLRRALATSWAVETLRNGEWTTLDGPESADAIGEVVPHVNLPSRYVYDLDIEIKAAFEGRPGIETLLRKRLPFADLNHRPISFSVLPLDTAYSAASMLGAAAPIDQGFLTLQGYMRDGITYDEVLGRPIAWMPAIRIGESSYVYENAFQLDGTIIGTDRLMARGTATGSALDNVSQSLLGFVSPEPKTRGQQAFNLWLELSLITPSGGQERFRRLLAEFDPARQDHHSAEPHHIVAQLLGLRVISASSLTPRPDIEEAHTFADLVSDLEFLETISGDDSKETTSAVHPLTPILNAFWVRRFQITKSRKRLYLAEPNIAMAELLPAQGTSATLRFDIIKNDVAVRSSDMKEAVRLKVEQGIVDTVVETLMPVDRDDTTIRNSALAYWRLSDEAAPPLAVERLDNKTVPMLDWSSGSTAGATFLEFPTADLPKRMSLWYSDTVKATVRGLDLHGRGAVTVEYLTKAGQAVAGALCAGSALVFGYRASYSKGASRVGYVTAAGLTAACAVTMGVAFSPFVAALTPELAAVIVAMLISAAGLAVTAGDTKWGGQPEPTQEEVDEVMDSLNRPYPPPLEPPPLLR